MILKFLLVSKRNQKEINNRLTEIINLIQPFVNDIDKFQDKAIVNYVQSYPFDLETMSCKYNYRPREFQFVLKLFDEDNMIEINLPFGIVKKSLRNVKLKIDSHTNSTFNLSF